MGGKYRGVDLYWKFRTPTRGLRRIFIPEALQVDLRGGGGGLILIFSIFRVYLGVYLEYI